MIGTLNAGRKDANQDDAYVPCIPRCAANSYRGLYMVDQPLWQGRLSGGKRFPTGTPKDTLESSQTRGRLWDQIKLARSRPLRGRWPLIWPGGVAVTRRLRKTHVPRRRSKAIATEMASGS